MSKAVMPVSGRTHRLDDVESRMGESVHGRQDQYHADQFSVGRWSSIDAVWFARLPVLHLSTTFS